MGPPMTGETLWEVTTPLDFRVRVTRSYWDVIVTMKHPAMGRAGGRCSGSPCITRRDKAKQARCRGALVLQADRGSPLGLRRGKASQQQRIPHYKLSDGCYKGG
jgi:hypothetical protein